MENSAFKVLLIEDAPGDVLRIQTLLAGGPLGPALEIEHADRLAAGLARLAAGGIDVVLLDLGLPDSEGMDTLVRVRAAAPDVPVVICAGSDDPALALRAVRQGAQDILVKDQLDRGLLIGTLRYAIERQRLAAAMTRQLLRIIDGNPDGIVIVNKDGVVRFANRQAEALLGCASAELVGSVFGLPVAAGGITELEVLRRDQRIAVVEMHVAESEWQEETVWIGSLRDISARRQLEEQAHKMELLGQLAGGIAHDFNNLLTVFAGYSDLLLMQLPPGDPRRRLAQELKETGNRAAGLTQRILAFSRKQTAQPRVVDLNAAVVDLVRMLRRVITAGIALVTRLAPDLDRVEIDPVQLDQVITNLVINARDAMPQGGQLTIATANVEIDSDAPSRNWGRPGTYVLLSVSDSGVGIDSQTQKQIFQPFFTTKERGQGTGLGLANVSEIVQGSGGCIEVESQPGQGATFRVYLPRVATPHSEDAPPPAAARDARGTETILLVEDDPGVLNLVGEMLRFTGYTVLAAADGSAALRLAEQHAGRIHLLLTDVVMPHMSGPELVRQLLAVRPNLPVLYMTGYPDGVIAEERSHGPALAVLHKPLTSNVLLDTVRSLLDQA